MKKTIKNIFALCAFASIWIMVGCNSSNSSEKSTTSDLPDTTLTSEAIAPDVFKLKLDSLGFKTYQVSCKPGDSIPLHYFPENVFYVTNPGTVEYTLSNGKKNISEFKKDSIYIRNAGCAISKNIGNTTVEGILFHILRPNTMDEAYNDSSDASVVEPAFYKILAESSNIRATMATYNPGQVSKKHIHADHITYVVKGGKFEVIGSDGTKNSGTLIEGSSNAFSRCEHIFKNTDTTSWKVLMIEVNRKFAKP